MKMSRHRDFHNMDHDDFADDDYGSSVSSYTDEVALSRSMEKEYMYRPGSTPKMSQFFGRTNSVSSVPEEDEDAGNEADSDDSSSLSSEGGRRHSSGSSLVESLNAEEAEKLASCLDYILDIVGEAIPEIQSKFVKVSYLLIEVQPTVDLLIMEMSNTKTIFKS